jgi:hypothetical protein
LTSNRKELIDRCKAKVEKNFPQARAADDHGVPLFLQQLVDTLYHEQTTTDRNESEIERTPAHTEIGRAAALHGQELLRTGYSVDQVVHEYGNVCQVVTDLAFELNATVTVDEFRTLNRCLDNAIADAVTAFASGHVGSISFPDDAGSLQVPVSSANEQRRLINLAIQTFAAIRTGTVGAGGATGTVLLRTLSDLRERIFQYPA